MSAYFFKLGGSKYKRVFQRRFFTYNEKEKIIKWYKTQGGVPKNSLALKFISKIDGYDGQKFGRKYVFSLTTPVKVYYLAAENEESYGQWLNSLKKGHSEAKVTK